MKFTTGVGAAREVKKSLTDPQIREVWNLPLPRVAPQLKILLLTGCRQVGFGTGFWEQVDWDECLFIIPAAQHKGKRDTIIPLSKPAMEILKTVPKLRDKIFGRYLESDSLAPAHKRMSLHLRPHDLRAVVATRMSQMGIQPNEIQLCLGQSVSGLLSVYNKHAYLDERRAAF